MSTPIRENQKKNKIFLCSQINELVTQDLQTADYNFLHPST
jgi:hypothetical protein